MNKICLLAAMIAVLGVMQAFAQTQHDVEKADSIVALLQQMQGEERLNAIASLVNLDIDPLDEKRYILMLLDEARRQKHITWEGKALRKLTLSYYHNHFSDSIFIVGDEAIRFLRQHRLYDDLFIIYGEYVRRYGGMGQTITALRLAEEVYAEAKELQDKMAMASMLSAIGHIYYQIDRYEEAAHYWDESITLAGTRKEANPTFIANHYHFLASLYEEINRPEEALRNADSLLVEINRLQHTDTTYNARFLHYLVAYHHALAYAAMKQPAKSIEAIRRAEALYDPLWGEETQHTPLMINEMYAAYFLAVGNYDKALEHHARVRRFNDSIDFESGVLYSDKRIAEVYDAKGDYKAAAATYRSILLQKEKVNNERFNEQINELRTIYNTDKAEMEAQRRLDALQRQRFVIAGLIAGCIVMMLIVGLTIHNRWKLLQKNRGLYLQIKEQDRLREALAQLTPQYDTQSTTDSPPAGEKNTKKQQLVADMHRYLLADKNFTNPDMDHVLLASVLYTNKTFLFDAHKEITGKTPNEYINDLRLEEFRKMIDNSSTYTLEAIASECGFNSYRTFHRLFQKRYRLSPAQYGKLAKTEEI